MTNDFGLVLRTKFVILHGRCPMPDGEKSLAKNLLTPHIKKTNCPVNPSLGKYNCLVFFDNKCSRWIRGLRHPLWLVDLKSYQSSVYVILYCFIARYFTITPTVTGLVYSNTVLLPENYWKTLTSLNASARFLSFWNSFWSTSELALISHELVKKLLLRT